jgi:hypothetical protein
MLQKMFSESSEISEMRVMALLSILVGSTLAAYGLCADKDLSGLSLLVGVFVAPAFVGKVAQKAYEKKDA